jgi:hypothetical protein
MAKNQWGWKDLDNMRVNADILKTLRGDNFVFRFFYDKRVLNGDTATFLGKTSNRRVLYHDNIDYADFKTSGTLRCDLEMIHFGCYGDVYSRDFGALAISEPGQLEEFIELHHENAMNELNNDINRYFKEGVHTDANFNATNGIIKNDKTFYESGTTMGKDNAEIVWDSIYTNAIRLCRRSNKFNVRGVMSNIATLRDIIIMYTPKIHAMIQSKLYAGTPHPEKVHFEPMFGGVGITDFSDHEFSSDSPAGRTDGAGSADYGVNKAYRAGDYGTWYDSKDHIVMLCKDSYKICDAINPPLYVDNSRLGLSLKTYFFKWFFGFAGFIDFVNALKWQEN